jgi:hypothetical protein
MAIIKYNGGYSIKDGKNNIVLAESDDYAKKVIRIKNELDVAFNQ